MEIYAAPKYRLVAGRALHPTHRLFILPMAPYLNLLPLSLKPFAQPLDLPSWIRKAEVVRFLVGEDETEEGGSESSSDDSSSASSSGSESEESVDDRRVESQKVRTRRK